MDVCSFLEGFILEVTDLLTQLFTVTAVYVEGLIALVNLTNSRIEDEPIRAESLGGTSIDTLVELVALDWVLVLTVLWWTLEALCICWKLWKWKIHYFGIITLISREANLAPFADQGWNLLITIKLTV